MKRLFLFCLTIMAQIPILFAHDFSATAPSGQTLYYNITSDSTVTVTYPGDSWYGYYNGYSHPTDSVVIPGFVIHNEITYVVTRIGDHAFYECTQLTQITIPNSVTYIGEYAFSHCWVLSSLTIPCSVVSLGDYVFYLSGIDTIYMLPETPPSYGYNLGWDNPVIILNGCSYNNYHNNSRWSNLNIQDPIINFNVYVTAGNVGGSAYVVLGRSNRVVRCDSTAVIRAVANQGYHFSHWNDGVTTSQRTITVNHDTSFTAYFERNYYVITGNTIETERGYVIGSDSVFFLDTVALTAIANYGYHFNRWHDNNTENPRMVVATGNITLTAIFDHNQYTISLDVDTLTHGTCTGSGSYNYLSIRSIQANANYGYHFTHWDDGITDNPRIITLTQDTNFTALFEINQYYVTGTPNEIARGDVDGSDTVYYLDTVILTATANYGYHFTRWSDNNTDNPRAVVATGNINLTAIFDYNQYTITAVADTSTHGNCTGGGIYNYLSTRTIQANANYGYHFVQWGDSVTDNPRIITLTQDTIFMAHFAPNLYTLTLTSNDNSLGSLSGGGEYYYLDTVEITATAVMEHYHFVQWNDGNTDNPRQFVVTCDMTLTAMFAIDTHMVDVLSSNIARGSVTGGGEFVYGTPCTVEATAYSGYTFVSWSNGATYNPYTFAVLEDVELTAIFLAPDEVTYTVTVESNDPTMGTATVNGNNSATVISGDSVTISAAAFEGYRFVRWNDNDTHAVRIVTVTADATYTAYFESVTQGIADVNESDIMIYVIDGRIYVRVDGEPAEEFRVYDLMGREVFHATQADGTPALPGGVYLVKVGTLPAKKMVVLR